MTFKILPEARDELFDAAIDYESKEPGLGFKSLFDFDFHVYWEWGALIGSHALCLLGHPHFIRASDPALKLCRVTGRSRSTSALPETRAMNKSTQWGWK